MTRGRTRAFAVSSAMQNAEIDFHPGTNERSFNETRIKYSALDRTGGRETKRTRETNIAIAQSMTGRATISGTTLVRYNVSCI